MNLVVQRITTTYILDLNLRFEQLQKLFDILIIKLMTHYASLHHQHSCLLLRSLMTEVFNH